MDDEAAPAATRERVIGRGVDWLARWTLRWLLVGLGALALGWLVGQVWSIVLPVLLALILTTVLQPPTRWLEHRLRLPSAVAALIVILLSLGVVGAVGVTIAPSVGDQSVELAEAASEGLTTVEQWVEESSFEITQAQVESVVTAAQDRLESSASTIASGVLVGVGAVTSALITFVVTLVLAFFFLKDGARFLPWVTDLAGDRAGPHLAEVGVRAWTTLGGFVRTQALVGLIDAVLIGTGLLLVGVPLALPLAVLTFVAAFAPIVGAVSVGALAVLVTLVANGWVSALIVLGIVLGVQQLEGNVLLPWLQGRSLRLHAGVVLLTIILGSTLFGVAGAFLGVPLVAVLAVVLRYLDELVRERTAPPGPAPSPDGDTGEVEDQSSDSPPGRTGAL
ncbi:pheromone autoinducer 2 transporter [Nocardioides dokdonensis FR1436]|uniref:Pheromone autoinducer 2 transporter n=1 Tax=Nocardioides dokdonensis FR1436 TaxID=1300347 RepID=A0A1A9GQV8_9ACTN|nr:AI-2E family transporter [Nocardioides dokdonensis]ANH40040.1 pheromone autoinducer 2 transporter [Nocardioides dokdonensis FR1436]